MPTRYKPQLIENYSDVDAAELIRETITIEKDIKDKLDKLLQMMGED